MFCSLKPTFDSDPSRVVSLYPAGTEIVALLNAEHLIIGRSHECDWPCSLAKVPVLTTPNIDPTLSSADIDIAVKTSGDQPLFTLDTKQLEELRPDLIITQSTCGICAIDTDTVFNAAKHIELSHQCHPQILSLNTSSLDDLFQDISRVAEAIKREDEAAKIIQTLTARCRHVIDKSATKTKSAKQKPRVALIEWLDPPMSAGNWVPEMIQMAGAIDALEADAGKSHWIDWADVAAADPDIVILIPCGFELERVCAEAKTPAVWPHLKDLRATCEGRLFGVDGHHLFNRPGPRLVDSLEVLAELLHPESFQFEATHQFAKRIEP